MSAPYKGWPTPSNIPGNAVGQMNLCQADSSHWTLCLTPLIYMMRGSDADLLNKFGVFVLKKFHIKPTEDKQTRKTIKKHKQIHLFINVYGCISPALLCCRVGINCDYYYYFFFFTCMSFQKLIVYKTPQRKRIKNKTLISFTGICSKNKPRRLKFRAGTLLPASSST